MPVTASVAAGERPATAAALGMALALAGAALACAAHGDDDSRRRGRLVPGAALASVASVGVLDGGANALFAFALTEGLTSTVSVLGSLYPVTTVVLAALLLDERVAPRQAAGLTSVLAGIALVSAHPQLS